MLAQASAATAAARRTTALPISVARKSRRGPCRLRAQAVRPLNLDWVAASLIPAAFHPRPVTLVGMRRMFQLALLLVALAICGAVPAQAALTPTINTFPSSDPPSGLSGPRSITAGSDGALWFAQFGVSGIARITVDGRITLQAPAYGFPYAIAAGSDGAIWFADQSPSSVGRVDAAGDVQTKNLSSGANPYGITSGPEGALWLAEASAKVIGRIPATTPLAVPDESRTTEEGATAIAAGSDGKLWFTQYSSSKIGRMTPAGGTTYFPLPTGFENPEAITAGPDGALWYTTLNPPGVVRIATDGSQRPFPLPKKMYPGEIAAGPDGALWFGGPDEIGRITTGGEIEGFKLPLGVGLFGVTPGPDGNVWFTEANVGRIGRITTPPNATTIGASDVNAGEAKVAGRVDGHSQPTDVVVEYGPAGAASNRTSPLHLAASAADQPVTIPLSSLVPSTTYRYRVVATNPTGSTTGGVRRIHHRAATAMPDHEIQDRRERNPGRLAQMRLDELDQRDGEDRLRKDIGQEAPWPDGLRSGPRQGRQWEGDAADQA